MTAPEEPVEIVPYDPSWPRRFDEEQQALRRGLAPWLAGPIEHIGSTAIPRLAAKPVIDIMAGVQTLEDSRPAIQAAADLGYCALPTRLRALVLQAVALVSNSPSPPDPTWKSSVDWANCFSRLPSYPFRSRRGIRDVEATVGTGAPFRPGGLHRGEASVHCTYHRRRAERRLWLK